MLQFINRQDNAPVWINPQHVSAIVHASLKDDPGCTLFMAGGFEIRVRETAEEALIQINKRLNAY